MKERSLGTRLNRGIPPSKGGWSRGE